MTQANIAFGAEDDEAAQVPLLSWDIRASPRREHSRHHRAFLFWNARLFFV
jgi:hypothetical protein